MTQRAIDHDHDDEAARARKQPETQEAIDAGAPVEGWQALQQSLGNQGVRRLAEREGLQQAQRKAAAEGVTPVSPAVQNAIEGERGRGEPLEPALRSEMETSVGADFGGVRLHQDATAQQLSGALGASAFTQGSDVFLGAGRDPRSGAGKQTLAHELTHVAQGRTGPGSVQRDTSDDNDVVAAPKNIKQVPVNERDEDGGIARQIMDYQQGMLEAWRTALLNFDKVITSASDKESKPDFNKAIMDWVGKELIGKITEATAEFPGVKQAISLLTDLQAEETRAKAANLQATIRDFFVDQNTNIGKLLTKLLGMKEDFVAQVNKVRAEMYKDDGAQYSMMRMYLVELHTEMAAQAQKITPEYCYLRLSEEWLNHTAFHDSPSQVYIKLNEDFTVDKAEIQGPGGQRIAEELLRESPQGVDLLALDVKREFAHVVPGGYGPHTIIGPGNRYAAGGTFIDSKEAKELYQQIIARRTLLTKNIEGV